MDSISEEEQDTLESWNFISLITMTLR
jgi:hypothetical protein